MVEVRSLLNGYLSVEVEPRELLLHRLYIREHIGDDVLLLLDGSRHVQGTPSECIQIVLEEHEELLLTPGINLRSNPDESGRV